MTVEALQAAVAHYQADVAAAEEKLKAARADYHAARKALEQHESKEQL